MSIKSIRNATAELLTSSIPSATVFNSKITPQMVKHLPSIAVYVESYDGVRPLNNVKAFLNSITLQIVVLVAGDNEDWADEADDYVNQILSTLVNDATWRGQFNNIANYQVQYDHGSNGQKTLGSARISITGTVLLNFS